MKKNKDFSVDRDNLESPLELITIHELKDNKINLNKCMAKWKKSNIEVYKNNKQLIDNCYDELIYAGYTICINDLQIDFINQLKELGLNINTENKYDYLSNTDVIEIEGSKEELLQKYNTFKNIREGFIYPYGAEEKDIIYDYNDVLNVLKKLIDDKPLKASRWINLVISRVSLGNYITKSYKGIIERIKDLINKHRIKLIDYCMKAKKIASFSGGKDSAYMIVEAMNRGIEFDYIVFADTTLEFPEMYSYIDKFEKFIGKEVIRLKSDITFNEWFFKPFSRGKNEGKIHGFPFVVGQGCWIKRDLKLRQIKEFKKSLNGHYVDYIGIAYNEPERYKSIKLGDQFAPLYEWKITEEDCINKLKEINMLNPLYEKFKRLGCWNCSKQSMQSLYMLYKEYPELWEQLKYYQSLDWKPFKPNATIEELEYKFNNDRKYIEKGALYGYR